MENFEQLQSFLASPKEVVITCHAKPDADALGSSLGLKHYLDKKGHRVTVVTPTDYAHFITWMKGNDDVVLFEEKIDQATKLTHEADVIFCLDYSATNRVGDEYEGVISDSSAKIVNIDHHIDPEDFADFRLWDTKAAATAELIYKFITMDGGLDLIDKDIAECLYAGIMTDTGSFRFPSTTKDTHLTIADLIDKGADNSKVHRLVYDNNSLNRLKFLGFSLYHKLVVLPEYHTAYFAVSEEELKQFESKTGDTEGIVNYALSLENVVFAAIIVDRGELRKMSFRSKGHFGANSFAKDHFSGGGHKNAAGGKSESTLKETEEKFVGLLDQYKEKLELCYSAVCR